MEVRDAIGGEAGVAGVRWLLTGPPRAGLAQVLDAMLEKPAALTRCRLTRVKWKPGRRLTACFDVSVRGPRQERNEVRPVSVTWTSEKVHVPDRASGEIAGLTPFRTLAASSSTWDMRVQIAPLDPRFPQLSRLFDTRRAREITGSDKVRIRWVRYRPGQRHILRYDAGGGAWTAYAKLYREGRSKAAFANAEWLSRRLASRRSDVACAIPLLHLAADDAVLFPAVPGVPLSRLLRQGGPSVGDCLRSAGAALRLVQQAPLSEGWQQAADEPTAEVAAVRKPTRFCAALAPATSALLDNLLDRAAAVGATLDREPPTFCHGDYKADHVWAGSHRLTLIDFDNCRLADPAIDAANFLADLGWWYRESGIPGIGRARELFLEGYAPPAGRLRRIRFYEALDDVRLSVHRLPLLAPRWKQEMEMLAARFRAALDSLDEPDAANRWERELR